MFRGRATLTGGGAAALGSAVRKALDDVTRIAGAGPVPTNGIEAHYSQLAAQLNETMKSLGHLTLSPADGSADPNT